MQTIFDTSRLYAANNILPEDFFNLFIHRVVVNLLRSCVRIKAMFRCYLMFRTSLT